MARFTSLRHGPDNLNAEQGWALGWRPTLLAVHPPSGPGHLELSLLSPHVCRFASGMFRLLHSDCDVVAYVFCYVMVWKSMRDSCSSHHSSITGTITLALDADIHRSLTLSAILTHLAS